jgi:dTDP-4-dehydrorhamnose reductase
MLDARLAPIILVTGSSGQVGFELRRSLAPLGRVVVVDRTSCDLADSDAIRAIVRRVRPEIIVNAAAYTAVDKAEAERDLAFAINATAAGTLAEEACALDALLLHYSTDYVFDGMKAGAYVESDATMPRSVYGASKLAGERAILASGARGVILRTSWVAGAHGQNFAKTILRLAAEREELRVIADQFGAPTTASLIADVSAIIARRLHGEQPAADASVYGVYHLAASGVTTWHGYATEVVRYAMSRGKSFQADPARIAAIPTEAYPLPAPRPANSQLDTSRLRATFGIHLPDWQEGVHHLLDQIFS